MRPLSAVAFAIVALSLLASPRLASAQLASDVPVGCAPKMVTPALDPDGGATTLPSVDTFVLWARQNLMQRLGWSAPAPAPRAPHVAPARVAVPARRVTR